MYTKLVYFYKIFYRRG